MMAIRVQVHDFTCCWIKCDSVSLFRLLQGDVAILYVILHHLDRTFERVAETATGAGDRRARSPRLRG